MKPLLALAFVFYTASASAQIIVNTGDDIVAICNAAPSGSVIQIQSDAVFVGQHTWSAKELTIEAAPGFSPTLRGPVDNNCIQLVPGNPPTKATFKNLTIERGPKSATFPVEGFPLVVQTWGTSDLRTEVYVENCTLLGRPTFSGSGNSSGKGVFVNSTLLDNFLAQGFPLMPLELSFEDCVVNGSFQVFCLNTVSGLPRLANVTLRRTLFGRELDFNASPGNMLVVAGESCVVDGDLEPGTTVHKGVNLFDNVVGTFTNWTILNTNTAIKGVPGVQLENALLVDNGVCLETVDLGQISNSLIEDGTYAGLNGNLAGSATLDSAYRLVGCSVGLDQGNNGAVASAALDLNGQPRIQDNDGDLVATVNMGATEATGFIPGNVVLENGSNINPVGYLVFSSPVIGTTLNAFIPGIPSGATVLTAIVAAAPIAPTTSGAYVGELLVSLSGSPLYFTGTGGPLPIPIPNNCALIGLTVRTQGFRFDNVGGSIVTHCLNRRDLTIGG